MSWPQQGKEKISKATLRPCYSLNDEGFKQDQNNLNNVKSSSLGEIVVSFELSPSYLPREKLGSGTEAFDENFVASKIVPMLANVRINRNRSYSANDVFEEEVEWAVETTNPTRADSIKSLAAEKGNAQKMERFFVLQYRETHFLDLFVLNKKMEKLLIFDKNHGLTPF